MSTVTISSKYQIVLPEEVRLQFDLRAGQKIKLLDLGGTLTIVPVRPTRSYRGLLKGHKIDLTKIREKKDRDL